MYDISCVRVERSCLGLEVICDILRWLILVPSHWPHTHPREPTLGGDVVRGWVGRWSEGN